MLRDTGLERALRLTRTWLAPHKDVRPTPRKSGYKIFIDAHPMKDGSHGGRYLAGKLERWPLVQAGPNPNANNAGR